MNSYAVCLLIPQVATPSDQQQKWLKQRLEWLEKCLTVGPQGQPKRIDLFVLGYNHVESTNYGLPSWVANYRRRNATIQLHLVPGFRDNPRTLLQLRHWAGLDEVWCLPQAQHEGRLARSRPGYIYHSMQQHISSARMYKLVPSWVDVDGPPAQAQASSAQPRSKQWKLKWNY